MNKNNSMQCKLCLQFNELQKSHIIPEFLYKSLYDEKHRLRVLSIIPEQENSLREQKGLREQLLCKICEKKLSVWERYACLLLEGGVPITYRAEGSGVHLSELDYVQFKLFQLSILWRAGISSLQFFENVKLGVHAEHLRKLLVSEDPGPPNRYGCFMFGLKLESTAFTQVITQPEKIKIDGRIAYRFVFGGFLWIFIVTSHESPSSLTRCFLQPNGNGFFLVRDAVELRHLKRFTLKLKQMGREP
jgi:hypothetical protein